MLHWDIHLQAEQQNNQQQLIPVEQPPAAPVNQTGAGNEFQTSVQWCGMHGNEPLSVIGNWRQVCYENNWSEYNDHILIQ